MKCPKCNFHIETRSEQQNRLLWAGAYTPIAAHLSTATASSHKDRAWLLAELEKARKWKERAEKLDKFSKLKIEQLDIAEATIERVRGLFAECVPVIANSRNTHSVRDGLEQGGYIKYIEMPRTTYIKFKAALENEDG